ncbi:hypothetical protein [Hymenobacter convexus]|uniref:hypothetical protein n=1 Tax=Hymenobacter sp. CA1UV-4 TaxID=3063782 RepID=UPI0027123094|nr:hypothetical protein [Hymenobacter sp. CA1UV-4]MDO7852467.1 hypothetical protein [Hymenobacter sp. CA1UV-4]
MKTTLITLLFASASLGAAWAQAPGTAKTVTIHHVKKGQEPQKVMSALEKDFPGSIVQDMSAIPGSLYGQEWSVTEAKPTGNQDNLQYYQVNASSKGMKYTAVYDQDGNLISSRRVLKDTPLPIEAMKNVATQFPDWKVIGNKEKFTIHKDHDKVAYKVEIQKGQEIKKVFLDENGRITRVVKNNRIRI